MNCKNCSWYQLGVCDAPILVRLKCYVWRFERGEQE